MASALTDNLGLVTYQCNETWTNMQGATLCAFLQLSEHWTSFQAFCQYINLHNPQHANTEKMRKPRKKNLVSKCLPVTLYYGGCAY